MTRRRFLGFSTVAGGALLLPWKATIWRAIGDAGRLDPLDIPKYKSPLVRPRVMPKTFTPGRGGRDGDFDYYEIGTTQFPQQILPPPLPKTQVWGYGSVNHPDGSSYPGYTIEATVDRPVRIKWINSLVDRQGNPLPHLLPEYGKDDPVPIVTHLHGSHASEESDGYPEAWYTSDGGVFQCPDPDACYNYNVFRNIFYEKYGVLWDPGTATFQYANDQFATALAYHDHAIDITRLNVYAGLFGMYILRGGQYDLPEGILPGTPNGKAIPSNVRLYEIPLVIQDRSFNKDGSLLYDGQMCGSFNGDTMVVNGRTWPYLEVEPRRYRFRIVNASSSRFLSLKFLKSDNSPLSAWQIGVDGGFLRRGPQPIPGPQRDSLTLWPAERADMIVDFGALSPGSTAVLQNVGPGAATGTTDQVMQFRAVPLTSQDYSVPPDELQLPRVPNVADNAADPGPITRTVIPACGTWSNPITETPTVNVTEEWTISAVNHPIHLHQVQFDIESRNDNAPPPWEDGPKDTVQTPFLGTPKIKVRFDLPGRYVWHCHILEHEDANMMRPIEVAEQ